MSDRSTIEWTDATWNPVTGCTKVSPGCKHCYAETFAERWRGVPGHPYEQGFDLRLWPERLNLPLKWKSPRMIFVNSMSDLFHEAVPDTFIYSVFRVMAEAPRHTFQVLTKRADRLTQWHAQHPEFWFLPHIWLGVSVEDRRFGLVRIPKLRRVRSSVRFLSIEPLLEDIGGVSLEGIDWVIVGGESGAYVRTFEMLNEGNRTEYVLFYGTRSPAGLSKMKQAMWKVDPEGGQVFSDRSDPRQMVLLQAGGEVGLSRMLQKRFRGKGFVAIETVERFVLEETPYSEKMHLKHKTLGKMERASPSQIEVRRPRGARERAGDYPSGTLLKLL